MLDPHINPLFWELRQTKLRIAIFQPHMRRVHVMPVQSVDRERW